MQNQEDDNQTQSFELQLQIIYEQLKQNNISESQKLLDLLEEQLEVCVFKKGSSQLRKIYQPISGLCYFIQLSFGLLIELDQCFDYLEAVQQNFVNFFYPIQNQNDYFHIKYMNQKWIWIQMQLQQSAILSQLDRHEEAIQSLKNTYSIILKELNLIQRLTQNQLKVWLNPQIIHSQDSIEFKKIIVNNAYPLIMQINEKLVFLYIKQHFNQNNQIDYESLKIYFWKSNPENNEKQFRRQFNSNQSNGQKSILGVLKKTSWLNNLTIGSLMLIQPFSLNKFQIDQDFFIQISQKNLTHKFILLSICLYSISTEIRLNTLLIQKNDQDQSYILQFRKLYHLKAIEILCQVVKEECPLVTHMINTFQKYHGNQLENIIEEFSNFSSKQSSAAKTENSDKTIKIGKQDVHKKPQNKLSTFLNQQKMHFDVKSLRNKSAGIQISN